MSRTNSTGAFQGFSVVQPFLGASLQWLPALGTQELDDMINAFLPGPSSIQDKRAHISMDFFEFARQTGENFKFYPVPSTSFTSAATSSPASSAALYDSGYASNFNVSPVAADSQWAESPATFTPSSFDETSARSPGSSTSKRPAASSSRQRTTDFSSHPGMRIMTKDGRDVTNSASRGCKTKEQRDHAHLMRIIKACDSCKRKKIRCDPSHKKRSASQVSPAQSEQKSSKKSKKKAADPPPTGINEFSLDFLNTDSLAMPDLADSFPYYESSSDNLDELWDQLVQQDPAVFANDYLNYVPDDYNLFTHQLSHVSPSSTSSSTSPPQPYTPYTPTPPGPSPHTVVYETIPEMPQGDPTLPYLNPGVPHGTDYVDFNLFSPPPDFSLDEEPRSVKSSFSGQRQQSDPRRSPVSGYDLLDTAPPLSSGDIAQADGILHSEPWSSHVWSSPRPTENTESVDFTPSQSQTRAQSPGGVRLDSRTPVHDLGVTQQSDDPGHHVIDRARPVLASDASRYAVQSAASPSEDCRVTVQSTVSASLRRGTGQDTSGEGMPVSPGFSLATPSTSTTSWASPTSQDSPPWTSASTPASSVVVPDSTEVSRALFNASSSVPALSSLPTHVQSSRHVEASRVSAPSALVQSVGSVGVLPSPNVDASVLTHVSIPASGQYSVSAGSDSLVHQPAVQHGLVAPAVDIVSSSVNAALATIILSTLPVQRILAGEATKPGQASSPSSLVYSQLVVFGLVSYLLACLLDAQYLGSLPDLLSTLITITSVSLAILTTQNRLSVLESAKVVTSTTQSSTTLIDNVKSGIQAAGQRFYDFRCTVRQRAISFTRRIPLPRLASVQSLSWF